MARGDGERGYDRGILAPLRHHPKCICPQQMLGASFPRIEIPLRTSFEIHEPASNEGAVMLCPIYITISPYICREISCCWTSPMCVCCTHWGFSLFFRIIHAVIDELRWRFLTFINFLFAKERPHNKIGPSEPYQNDSLVGCVMNQSKLIQDKICNGFDPCTYATQFS